MASTALRVQPALSMFKYAENQEAAWRNCFYIPEDITNKKRTMMRLETVAKDLAAKLRAANSTRQRAASLLACQLALQAAQPDGPTISDSLEQLGLTGPLLPERIKVLNDLTAHLDEKYFDLQDRVEEESGLQSEALRFFSQARAVSALSLAAGSEPLVAAMESIYEASVAVDDPNRIFEAVLLVL